MIIQPTSLAALTWAGAAAGTSAQSWRIGTVLSARPLGVNPQGMLVLQIGALTVETAIPGNPLPAQFQVRVLSLGAQPQLEQLTPSPADATFQRALRERLPQQNGYAPLLSTLDSLAQRPMLRQLPPPLRAALAMLENGMSTPAEITQGEGLRLAISRSGLFFESQLAQPQGDLPALVAQDWKGALLRLFGLLEQRPSATPASGRTDTAPPLLQRGLRTQARLPPPLFADGESVAPLLDRLHGDVKAALARVEIVQLEASTLPAWMIEIPLQGDGGHDVLQLQLEYVTDADDGSHGWTLGFALDLPTLGPVQGELQLRDLRLSVRLWTESATAAQRLERQFTPLRHRLSACGVLLDQLSCQVGLPQPSGRHSALLLQATA
ncbi:MAG: flagellar hook-length control protein FliK [Xanthomonadaceae bacterium]|nr:flagellar hook-length control protein FliK [Xanthomonadaceae bacterium]MDE3072761.1 flagellar hook-length control protein FliK [Pseudomonadota bacterium]